MNDEPKSASGRYFRFMLEGLHEVDDELRNLGIPFFMLNGEPQDVIPDFAAKVNAGAVICDFMPLKYHERWRRELVNRLNIRFTMVDAHNVVPVWQTSHKKEYAARTIRPKINNQRDQFLLDFPKTEKQKFQWKGTEISVDWDRIISKYPAINYDYYKPGIREANVKLLDFKGRKLRHYDTLRNNPEEDWQSGLSPYMHFGNIAPQRVAYEIKEAFYSKELIEAFLEEQIVRRELTDNYCNYNEDYDNINGADDWALKTIEEHRDDAREYVYSFDEFEQGKTHDHLWNAAQKELVHMGKMHGYLRMYWAKKILEWTPSATDAFDTALELNDKYSLDGCDPNGYVGVAWSVCGVHDRAWKERPVFGKIRYMNYNGCKSKFKIAKYIERVERSI
jgi:deoxyribodipyrimidine photo-lyase